MLEVTAHNHVKRLLKKKNFEWSHNLTLTRVVSRSLRLRSNTLINIRNGSKDCWWLGLLVPLCLERSNAILVLSRKQRRQLIEIEVPKLKSEGLELYFWEYPTPPPPEHVWLLDYGYLHRAFSNGWLNTRHLIVPEGDYFSERLRDALSLEITSEDWDHLISIFPALASSIVQIYQRLNRRLFSQSTHKDETIRIEMTQLSALNDLFSSISLLPSSWQNVCNAIRDGWVCWAQLQTETLRWTLHFEPIEPLKTIAKDWNEYSFLLISDVSQSNLLLSEFKSAGCPLPIQLRVGVSLKQKSISLFVPKRQPLPNTSYFFQYVLVQCRRLILGRSGLTLILLNDPLLRRQLTSELAGDFGLRVLHEEASSESNRIICCSCDWWFKHQDQLLMPQQLVFPLVPFPSLSSPLIAAKIEVCKQLGQDWFREFLLPETLCTLTKVVAIIRNHDIRVSILDGRLRYRSWGQKVFRTLEPWKPLERLLPY